MSTRSPDFWNHRWRRLLKKKKNKEYILLNQKWHEIIFLCWFYHVYMTTIQDCKSPWLVYFLLYILLMKHPTPLSFPFESYGRVEKVLRVFNNSKDCWINSIIVLIITCDGGGGPVFTVGCLRNLVHVLLLAEQEQALNGLLSFDKGGGLIWAVFSCSFIYFRKYCCRWRATRLIIPGGKLPGWPHFQNHDF